MSTLLASCLLSLLAADPVELFPADQSPGESLTEGLRYGITDTQGGITYDEGTHRIVASQGFPNEPWKNQIVVRTTEPIAKGDVLLLTLPLEVIESEGDVGRVKTSLTKEATEGNNEGGLKYDEVHVQPGQGLQNYYVQLTSEYDVAAGEGRLALHFSPQAQTLRLGELSLKNYGPDYPLDQLPRNSLSYQGREPDAAWRAEAAARIKEHRTGPIRVKVVDEDGNPVENAFVSVKLDRHDFAFGSAVVYGLLGGREEDFPVGHWVRDDVTFEDAEKYREIVGRLFNRVTFEGACRPYVWPQLHNPKDADWPKEAFKRQAMLQRAFQFLAENEVDVRGHYLSWGAIDSEQQSRFLGKPKQHAEWLAGIARNHPIQLDTRVVEWDAINHPCGWGTTMEMLHGGLDQHVQVMKIARAAAPEGVRLYLNEGHVLHERSQVPFYERIIKHLNAEGVGPDGIGFMGHFTDNTLTGMDTAYEVFERFAPLADRLLITELDISSASDERLHADYLRDIVTLAYSHPKMDGVVMWGFWEGAHWLPETALYRRDWSPKPAAEEWERLITETFATQVSGRTGADGLFTATGHHGTYQVYAETDSLKSWQRLDGITNGETVTATLEPKDANSQE